MITAIKKQFIEKFGREPLIISAPGRVNLIGEHTDYNDGFVLPGAIDKVIVVAVAKNDSDKINVYARQFDEEYNFSPHNIGKASGWQNYILGVTHYFQQQTKPLTFGLDVIIDGDVPVGGGMSSSAALCSAFGMALNTLFDGGLSRMDLAYIGQKTEHNFVGTMCGIMDQFASLHGKAGNLMKLDCRSLEYEYIPFNFPDYRIVLVNTMVKHSLAGTEYNDRRKQCEAGVEAMKEFLPGIKALRDVSSSQLHEHRDTLDAETFKRCKYVVEEIERVGTAADLLRQGDLDAFGKLMYQTHDGLSKEYEVSCEELDYLVELARTLNYVKGGRMMGGGFGGCTINIVESAHVDEFVGYMQQEYEKKYNVVPEVYITRIEDGAKIIE